MISIEKIKELLARKIEGTGIFLVDVIISQGNRITVYLDKTEGISLDECVGLNRYLNANLDRDIEDYELEVSSPGLGSPFKVKEQFEKNMGKDVEVQLNSGEKLTGKLLSFSGHEMELEVLIREEKGKKGRKLIPKIIKIVLEQVKSTKRVISFK
jgi:ribosome maturation factor RimP